MSARTTNRAQSAALKALFAELLEANEPELALFRRVWAAALGPPRLGFYAALNHLVDAAREEGRAKAAGEVEEWKKVAAHDRKARFIADDAAITAESNLAKAEARIAELEGMCGKLSSALEKIDAIRNSIIGLQKMDWSEHIYPLVAALDQAGFEGMEYPEARANYGTMLQRAVAAEARIAELTQEGEEARGFAQGWHRAVETILTICGQSSALGAQEAVEEIRNAWDELSAEGAGYRQDAEAALSRATQAEELVREASKELDRWATRLAEAAWKRLPSNPVDSAHVFVSEWDRDHLAAAIAKLKAAPLPNDAV